MTTLEILKNAAAVRPEMALLTADQKNKALLSMADRLEQAAEAILTANAADLAQFGDTMTTVMQDRLRLTEARIKDMASGIREVVDLPDPIGAVLEQVERPNGLLIQKTSVPMGVVAIQKD